MTITLELSTEQEHLLRESTARRDAQAVRQVLLQIVDSKVDDLLRSPYEPQGEPDFEGLADQLVKAFAATNRPDHRPLSDEAVTREGIYGDHP